MMDNSIRRVGGRNPHPLIICRVLIQTAPKEELTIKSYISTAQDWFDPTYTQDLAEEVIAPVAKNYFRLKLVGLENLPDPKRDRPIILAANHAGRCFPWDGILLDYAVSTYWRDHFGLPVEEKPRVLVYPQLSVLRRNFPFRLDKWWYRVGCVDATAKNFMDLLKQGRNVIIFPEGVPGMARDYKYRYQLIPFKTPLLRLASRYNADILPVTIVGSEYFHPWAFSYPWMDKVAKFLQFPFLHISPVITFLPILPFLYYTALPAPVTIHFGEPIHASELAGEEEDWETGTEKLRQVVQAQLNQDVAKYDRGFEIKGLIASLKASEEPFWKLIPTYWPHRFIKHARKFYPGAFKALPSPWWFWLPIAGLFEPKLWWKKPPVVKEPEGELAYKVAKTDVTSIA